MAQLAIKGHPTRGKEVIQLLEMLGGNNIFNYEGTQTAGFYYIENVDDKIYHSWNTNSENVIVFTLEEFFEKFPYKVGDEVEVRETGKVLSISNMIWEDELSTVHYGDMEDIVYYTADELQPHKEPNMNKKLAIKGHKTRGKKVIRLLEMLGADRLGYKDTFVGFYYYIECGVIVSSDECPIDAIVFTIEEFEEKFPYKVDDVVVNHKYGKGLIIQMLWIDNEIVYEIQFEDYMAYCKANELCKYDAFKGLLLQELTEYLSHATREELDKTMEEIEIALAPFKVGDKVIVKGYEKMGEDEIICVFKTYDGDIKYKTKNHLDTHYFMEDSLTKVEKSNKEENMEKRLEPVYELGTGKILYYVDNNSTTQDKGNISDGYHTFNELYEYRLLYNASMFNELAKQSLYDVHKSKLHSDGTIPFGDENWFIVQAELPTGQISNHYEMKDWDLFQVPIKEKANPYDGHTPQDVAKRLREFLTPKSQYPKDYEECCQHLGCDDKLNVGELIPFQQLVNARNAYWKIAGKGMGLDKPWKPDFTNIDNCYLAIKTCKGEISLISTLYIEDCILVFPTKEMRDAFFENFKDLIEQCKELL